MLRVKIYWNPPFEGCTGNAQILKSRKEKIVHHLIFTGNRLNKLRMLIDICNQTVCIFAHFEEICLFLCRCTRTSAVRTFAVYKLGLGKEGLTRSTVHSFVVILYKCLPDRTAS